ncbi:hypothetical protein JXA47_13055 [Candidatus Sumerlaeota bacterium]|nr:hypothetical protein [Candidatus Sumerlaeota bacterium]
MPHRDPTRASSLLWVLLGLEIAIWAVGLWFALVSLNTLDPLVWGSAPAVGAIALGWAPAALGLGFLHRHLRRRLGDPVAPLRLARVACLVRGLGLGLIAAGAWESLQGYMEMEIPRLALGTAAVSLGVIGAVVGHGVVVRSRHLQGNPWRVLERIQRVGNLEDPLPVARLFEDLRHATARVGRADGDAVEARARPILVGLRDHAVTHLHGLAEQGRGEEALGILGRWTAMNAALEALLHFLQITPERLATLRVEIEQANAHHWAERRAAIEPLVTRAEALLEEAPAAQALQQADEALLQIGEGVPPAPLEGLHRRAAAVQSRAREAMTEAHRSAVAAAEAVTQPTPQSDETLLSPEAKEAVHEALDRARDALDFARRHLERGAPRSALGWLEHAEYHTFDVGGTEHDLLRSAVAELRGRCALALQGEAREEPGRALLSPESGQPLPDAGKRLPWRDLTLILAGVALVVGFLLPWQRGLAVSPLPSMPADGFGARNLGDMMRLVRASIDEGYTATGTLAVLEILAACALPVCGVLGILVGIARWGSTEHRMGMRLLLRLLRVLLLATWLGVALVLFSVWIDRSALGWQMLVHGVGLSEIHTQLSQQISSAVIDSEVATLGPPASGFIGMLSLLLWGSHVGLWLMILAFPTLSLASIAPARGRAK